MAYTDQKSKTTDSRPGVNVTQTNKGAGATIAYVIAAIVVVVGAYMLFFNDMRTTPVVPSVTQNNTATPAPDAATPPAAEQTTPPAPAPATPPAANP